MSGSGIVTAGLVRAVTIEGGALRCALEAGPARAEACGPVRAVAGAAPAALPRAENVPALLTAHSAKAPASPSQQPPRLRAGAAGFEGGVLVAGVYGPLQPRMLGVSGRPASPVGKTIRPLGRHGVTVTPVGPVAGGGQAMIRRGQMPEAALQQMRMQVQRRNPAVLATALPPGTGGVQLTLARMAQADGASSAPAPQDVALIQARKGTGMSRKVIFPVPGMVENMPARICSNCGREEHVLGHGGIGQAAAEPGEPLPGEVAAAPRRAPGGPKRHPLRPRSGLQTAPDRRLRRGGGTGHFQGGIGKPRLGGTCVKAARA